MTPSISILSYSQILSRIGPFNLWLCLQERSHSNNMKLRFWSLHYWQHAGLWLFHQLSSIKSVLFVTKSTNISLPPQHCSPCYRQGLLSMLTLMEFITAPSDTQQFPCTQGLLGLPGSELTIKAHCWIMITLCWKQSQLLAENHFVLLARGRGIYREDVYFEHLDRAERENVKETP